LNRLSALVLLFFTECNLYGMKTCLIQVCGRVVPRTRHIQTWKNSDCEQTCPCQVHSGISCFIIKIRPWSPYPFQLLLLWVAARFRLGLGSDPVASGEDSLSDDSMISYRSRLSTIGNRDLRAHPATSFFSAYERCFTCNVWLSDWWEKLCEACWKTRSRRQKDLDGYGGYMLFSEPRRSPTLVGEAVHLRRANLDEESGGNGKAWDQSWDARNGDS